MDIHASDLVFETVQDAVKIRFDQVGEFFVHRDVFVTADLNMHSVNSFSLTWAPRLDASTERRWPVFA